MIHRKNSRTTKRRPINKRLLVIALVLFVSSFVDTLMQSSVLAATPQSLTYSVAGMVKNCGTMQGGASDGQYLYFACASFDKSKVRIYKVTPDGQIVARGEPLSRSDVGHVNDMAYNTRLNLLVLGAQDWEANPGLVNVIRFVDPNTLALTGEAKSLSDDTGSGNICYNSSTDQYVVRGKIYDANFKYENRRLFTSEGVDDDAGTTEGKILSQGIECDSSFIYVMRVVWGKNGYNIISVYDWSGNNTGIYKIDLNDEGENMSVLNGSLYMGINEGAMSPGGDSANDYFLKIDGLTTGTSSRPLVLGSYNVKGIPAPGESGCEAKDRMANAVKHIKNMKMDIVGLQEFTDYNKEEPSKCNGVANKLLDGLNESGGNWKATGIPSGTDGSGYQETQASIIYNADAVVLVSDEAKSFLGGGLTDSWPKGNTCSGGSPVFHIAGFSDASGKTFYVASGHWCTDDASVRNSSTETLMKIMSNYSGQKFIVGDTNSNVGKEVEGIVTSNGYDDAHVTALQKVNETYGTMAGNATKSDHIIDRIYYDRASISAPSYYETLSCDTANECGSDHRPIVAVFPGVLIGTGNCGSSDPLSTGSGASTTNKFKALNNIHFTGGSSVCCDTASISTGLTGSTNGEKAYNFFIMTAIATNDGKPMTPAQAAGVVGNFMLETGGNTYGLKTDAHNDISGGHTGIAQWDKNRFASLKDFASSNGGDWKDLETQLKYVVHELETNYARVVKDDAFKTAANNEEGARTAAKRWNALYEVSGESSDETRANNAAQAFKDFGDAANTSSGTTTDQGAATTSTDTSTLSTGISDITSSCANKQSGDYVFPLKASKEQVRSWGNNPGTTAWASGLYHETVFAGYYAVDIMAPEGTPVLAFHSGKVIKVDKGSFGELYIEILDDTDKANTKYGTGYTYFYTHMSYSKGTALKEGDTVNAGMVIGYVGNKNDAWGSSPHLHIDKSQNPGNGLRGECTASRKSCPVASENRFVKIIDELHGSYEKLQESGNGT